jgi:hypothetical protein
MDAASARAVSPPSAGSSTTKMISLVLTTEAQRNRQ